MGIARSEVIFSSVFLFSGVCMFSRAGFAFSLDAGSDPDGAWFTQEKKYTSCRHQRLRTHAHKRDIYSILEALEP